MAKFKRIMIQPGEYYQDLLTITALERLEAILIKMMDK